MSALVFDSHIQEIDTFNSYYKSVLFRNNNLIIPYVNLAISEHPANRSKKLLYFDLAYMVFVNVTYLDVFLKSHRYKVVDENNNAELYHFGGMYLDYGDYIFNDIQIACEKAFLKTLEITRTSEEMWIPVNTDQLNSNIDERVVNNFFGHLYIPSEIRNLV